MAKKQTQTTSTQVETKVEEVKAKITVGATAIKIILDRPELTNKQVLEEVQKIFPSAQTTMACIAWYKSKLRKEGKIGPRVFKKAPKVEEAKA